MCLSGVPHALGYLFDFDPEEARQPQSLFVVGHLVLSDNSSAYECNHKFTTVASPLPVSNAATKGVLIFTAPCVVLYDLVRIQAALPHCRTQGMSGAR